MWESPFCMLPNTRELLPGHIGPLSPPKGIDHRLSRGSPEAGPRTPPTSWSADYSMSVSPWGKFQPCPP